MFSRFELSLKLSRVVLVNWIKVRLVWMSIMSVLWLCCGWLMNVLLSCNLLNVLLNVRWYCYGFVLMCL